MRYWFALGMTQGTSWLDLVDALAGACWPHAHGSNAYRPTT